eukprot:CAMPEP_0167804906 /NCGR_PEP_ID=MMETSP0111_2-20121227/20811_1 /TAXON_ID=91324 /ORGANISM="Lotharella globosa, Strain CCCM811" /LENGTH=178 /DNA_ID=CAMNT_0007701857 /DNA_START=571 /DNA_END=1107 /DNA_ORIENTATION=-
MTTADINEAKYGLFRPRDHLSQILAKGLLVGVEALQELHPLVPLLLRLALDLVLLIIAFILAHVHAARHHPEDQRVLRVRFRPCVSKGDDILFPWLGVAPEAEHRMRHACAPLELPHHLGLAFYEGYSRSFAVGDGARYGGGVLIRESSHYGCALVADLNQRLVDFIQQVVVAEPVVP